MKKRNIVDLPEDLVVEILSTVSAVSLVRLRSTSKRWNIMIKEWRFAKKHYANAPRHSLIIMLIASRVYLVSVDLHEIHNNKVKITSQCSLKDPLSDSLEEVDIRKVFHWDGLLLCTTVDNRVVVSNPSSCEIKWIQPRNSYKKFNIYALGKSSCNKYKILRMDQFNHTSPVSLDFEIYDFNSNSWRVVGKIIRDWFIPRCIRTAACLLMETLTGLLLLTTSQVGILYLVLIFQQRVLQGYLFRAIIFLMVFLLYQLLARDDPKICIATQSIIQELHINVWIATTIESTGAASWSKFLSVDLANLYKPFCFARGMNFLVDQENKVLVCRGKYWVSDVFLHVVGEDKCIQVHHHDAESRCSLVVNYVPTLVRI